MTDLLARLRAMEAAATKGPWSVVEYNEGESLAIHDARGDWRVCFMATAGKQADLDGIEANAALIVAMRNALPDLLARIEAMAGEIEGLREALAMAIPRNVCLTNRNIADSYVVPIEVTMGELRSMATALTAPSMKENEDGQS